MAEKKNEKLKALTREELKAAANKKFGKNTLITGDQIKRMVTPRATTGSLAFDVMLGGGWPLNNWNEIVGMESSGKTVMAAKTIAANQALDPDWEGLWVAAEEWVPDWMEALGVDTKRLDIVETNVSEEVFEIVDSAFDNQLYDGVVIDSLPALIPSEEAFKTMEDAGVSVAARLNNRFMRKSHKSQKRDLVGEQERDCLAIIINQWRMKIGVSFGDPRTTPGGQGKDFAYFTKVQVARDEWLSIPNPQNKDQPIKVGQSIKARTEKNKTAPRHRTATVDFYFSEGAEGFHAGEYDSIKDIFNLAVAYEVIGRPNNRTYTYEGDTLGTSRADAMSAVREDLDLQAKITKDVLMLTTRTDQ